MSEVEQRVLQSIEQHLLMPEMVKAAVDAYRAEVARAQGDRDNMRDRLAAELSDIERKLMRLLRLVEDGHTEPAIAGPRLNELGCRKRQLVAELEGRPAEPESIAMDDGGAAYRALIRNLRSELGDGRPGAGEASELVRQLVRRIEIRPGQGKRLQSIEVLAGSSGITQPTERDCINGCGGQI